MQLQIAYSLWVILVMCRSLPACTSLPSTLLARLVKFAASWYPTFYYRTNCAASSLRYAPLPRDCDAFRHGAQVLFAGGPRRSGLETSCIAEGENPVHSSSRAKSPRFITVHRPAHSPAQKHSPRKRFCSGSWPFTSPGRKALHAGCFEKQS